MPRKPITPPSATRVSTRRPKNSAPSHDVEHRGEREDDREQAGGEMLPAVIEQREVDAEQREPEHDEPRMLGERIAHAVAAKERDDEHHRRSQREAPHHRDFRRDHADLIMQRDPGKSPGANDRGIKAEIERSEAGAAHAQRAAGFASSSRTSSPGGNSICKPRRPPLKITLACFIAASSMKTSARFFWPNGEMPPTR